MISACAWRQQRREWGESLTDAEDGILMRKRYLMHDRDPLFTADFMEILKAGGVESIRLPPKSPNLNASAERLVRTIKESCLERMIFFGEKSLRLAIRKFIKHYHHERNHQGLANGLIIPSAPVGLRSGAIRKRERLAGLLNAITGKLHETCWRRFNFRTIRGEKVGRKLAGFRLHYVGPAGLPMDDFSPPLGP